MDRKAGTRYCIRRMSRRSTAAVPNACRECGAPLLDHRRRYCDEHRRERFTHRARDGRARAGEVLAQLRAEQRDPAHGGRAAQLRGAKNAAHQAAVRDWQGKRPDPAVFRSEDPAWIASHADWRAGRRNRPLRALLLAHPTRKEDAAPAALGGVEQSRRR